MNKWKGREEIFFFGHSGEWISMARHINKLTTEENTKQNEMHDDDDGNINRRKLFLY